MQYHYTTGTSTPFTFRSVPCSTTHAVLHLLHPSSFVMFPVGLHVLQELLHPSRFIVLTVVLHVVPQELPHPSRFLVTGTPYTSRGVPCRTTRSAARSTTGTATPFTFRGVPCSTTCSTAGTATHFTFRSVPCNTTCNTPCSTAVS